MTLADVKAHHKAKVTFYSTQNWHETRQISMKQQLTQVYNNF